MDSSTLGTGRLVLAKADSAPRRLQGRMPLPPGCAEGGCTPPVYGGCLIRNITVDPQHLFLMLQWAPPTGSPADPPLVFTYKSDAGNLTELGSKWAATYQRFAVPQVNFNPPPVNVDTPGIVYSYNAGAGSTYSTVGPGQNTLVGSSTTGWTETQPDGTAFNYAASGVLSSMANKAGLRWTLSWDSGFNLLQAIQGPLNRRTSFAYNGSGYMTRIQDPGGRITSLTVNANQNLTRITSPELCVTSFSYNSPNQLRAMINPLGERTSFISFTSGTSSGIAIQQPMGQRTTYTSVQLGAYGGSVFIDPRGGRTTFQFGGIRFGSLTGYASTDPLGKTTYYKWDYTYSQQLMAVKDARGVLTSFSYQTLGNGAYSLWGTQKTGYNSGTGRRQYAFLYNSNNQVKASVDELSNRSTFVWDSLGNRIAVVDPYNQRTSYIYDSMARLVAVENALKQRSTQTYDSQGRRLADINPLAQRTTYAYSSFAATKLGRPRRRDWRCPAAGSMSRWESFCSHEQAVAGRLHRAA